MIHAKSACFVVAAGVLVLACQSPSGSGSGAPAATGTATAKAASSDGCADGAYKDEKLKFCIKLPPGFKPAAPEEKSSGIWIKLENAQSKAEFNLRVQKSVTPDKAKEILAEKAKPEGDDKKEPGSEGDKTWVLTTFKGLGVQQFDMYTPGAEGMLFCSANAGPDEIGALKEACKSLRKL